MLQCTFAALLLGDLVWVLARATAVFDSADQEVNAAVVTLLAR